MTPKPTLTVSTQFLREVALDVNSKELDPWQKRELSDALFRAADTIERLRKAFDELSAEARKAQS